VTIRVVLAEDNFLFRTGTVAVIGELRDVELVAVAEDLPGLLAAAGELAAAPAGPKVVITDIRMPPDHQREGLTAAATIRARYPGTGIILLTQFAEPQFAIEFFSPGAAGSGYLLKERVGNVAALERALHEVADGGKVLDPDLFDAIVLGKANTPGSLLGTLTPRESEVLYEMSEGKNNATIARDLVLTERAVQKHINSVFSKLGLGDSPDVDRRVKAVLTLLKAGPPAG
jgi:DNA-binding NarL/FixJ family response regulator